MTYAFELPLLVLLVFTAASAVFVRDLISAVFIRGILASGAHALPVRL
jgi:uncharacterized MnhB-related membrane protein